MTRNEQEELPRTCIFVKFTAEGEKEEEEGPEPERRQPHSLCRRDRDREWSAVNGAARIEKSYDIIL